MLSAPSASSRITMVLGVLLFLGTLIFYFGPVLRMDDGDAFHTVSPIKILNPNLSDEELSQLDKSKFNYLAMIDAGSSGCRAHVFRYGKLEQSNGPLYVVPQHESKKVKPGLSSFAKNPSDAGASLQGLIDFMKEQVPEPLWSTTPIWLKATAGMRLLPDDTTHLILTSVRDFLADTGNSPFLFRPPHASVISGNEEGGYGWIAYNYMKKNHRTEEAKWHETVRCGGDGRGLFAGIAGGAVGTGSCGDP